MALHSSLERIETREDLAKFIEELRLDYDRDPDRWENADLPSFLEALAAWTEDMPAFFANRGQDIAEVPIWRLIATMLFAATSYE
jgi:hypothetical protein